MYSDIKIKRSILPVHFLQDLKENLFLISMVKSVCHIRKCIESRYLCECKI